MMQVQEEFVVIKGKRTKRSRPQSPLLETIISNNMMVPSPSSNDVATTTTTTSSSSSEHELRDKTELLEDDEDMAYCLILLAQGHDHAHKASSPPPSSKHDDHNDHNKKYLFQCKTCDRCFPSFQALGGHRASHNKPNNKLPNNSFVSDLNHDHDHYCDPNTTRNTILSLKLTPTSSKSNMPNDFYGTSITSTTTTTTTTKSAATKSKSHLCSICGAEFSSGQALGGHMRRHRNFLSTTTTSKSGGGNIDNNNIGVTESREAKKPRISNNVLKLDLNLPAPPEDDVDHHHHQRDQSSKFSFQTNEKVIVFSTASSLVDCHY